MNAARTGLVYSDAHLPHDPGRSHPAHHRRIWTIAAARQDAHPRRQPTPFSDQNLESAIEI